MNFEPKHATYLCGECNEGYPLCVINAKDGTVNSWICPKCKHIFYPDAIEAKPVEEK